MSSTDNILVSVVLPAYNAADFISQTLDSVIAQTHANFEVLVVDDCSSDSTSNIVKTYSEKDSRIRLLQLANNSGGPARPRNTALKKAAGGYIAFIDADDIWHPEKLSFQLSKMRELSLNFSSTRLSRFTHFPIIEPNSIDLSKTHEKVSFKRLLKKNILANSSVMLTADLAKDLRFSEHSRHAAVEDYLAWLDLHQSADINSARLGQRLVYYRVRVDSISRSKLQMARKIFGVLSEIEVNGAALGVRKYFYFFAYLWGSLRAKMFV